jgi:hypothetical protein
VHVNLLSAPRQGQVAQRYGHRVTAMDSPRRPNRSLSPAPSHGYLGTYGCIHAVVRGSLYDVHQKRRWLTAAHLLLRSLAGAPHILASRTTHVTQCRQMRSMSPLQTLRKPMGLCWTGTRHAQSPRVPTYPAGRVSAGAQARRLQLAYCSRRPHPSRSLIAWQPSITLPPPPTALPHERSLVYYLIIRVGCVAHSSGCSSQGLRAPRSSHDTPLLIAVTPA